MSKFLIEKKLELDWLGEGWNGCYISFNPLTYKELDQLSDLNIEGAEGDLKKSKQLTQAVIDLLKARFLSGKGWSGKEQIDIVAEDIDELPLDVITSAIKMLSGQVEKKD